MKNEKIKELQQPPLVTKEDISKFGLTPDFVESQKYYHDNYIALSEKYGDRWLIIGKDGVKEVSEDQVKIRDIFYSQSYVKNAILVQATYFQKKVFKQLSIPIQNAKIFVPMAFQNMKTYQIFSGVDFLFDTGTNNIDPPR